MAKSMTEGKEWKLILFFALPLMLGNLLQQLYNTVDGIIVGNYVGSDALASVGTCASLTMLFLALAIGMSNGCAIVVSQYFGAKQFDQVRRAVSTSIIVLIALGAVLSVVGVLAARPLLEHVLNVDALYLENAVTYFSIYAMGLVFQFTYNIFAAILRSVGDSKATLYFLLVSSAVNVVLDLLFVKGFAWGVAGAAIATVISQALSAVVCVVYMFKKHAMLRYGKGEFVFEREKFVLALRMGIPTTLQQCVVSFGHIAIQRLINTFEITYVGLMAGYTAAVRIENFVMIPIFAFNMGMATFAGQNMGAGRIDRVKRGLWVTEAMGVLCCLTIGMITFVAANPLVRMFGLGEGEGLEYGVAYIRFIAPLFTIFCFYLIMGGLLQGSGDVVWNTASSISGLVFRTVLAYILAFCTPVGYRAAWVSVPLGWLLILCIVGPRYRSGKWKRKGVVRRNENSEAAGEV